MRGWNEIAMDELRRIFSDRGVVLVLIGATLFYAMFYPLPYRDQVARDVPVVVVDLDRSAASRSLIRSLQSTEQIKIAEVVSEPVKAESALRQSKVAGIIEIPADFERQLLRGDISRIGVWGNAAYILLYSQVATAASNVAGTLSAGIMLERLEASGVPAPLAAHQVQPVELDMHTLFNPGGGYGSYVVPAVLVLILQQTLLIALGMMGAGRAMAMRQADTGEPLVKGILARTLPYIGLQMLLGLIVLAVVYRVYGFPSQAPLLASLALLLPFIVAAAGFGLLLSACFGNRETALQVLVLISIPTLFLAGFAWPAEAMPPLLERLGWLIPSTAGIDVFVRFHQMGAGFREVLAGWLWLWGLAIVYLAMSIFLSQRLSGQGKDKVLLLR